MQLKIEITDPNHKHAVAVAVDAEAWPELLDAFLSAVIAAQFVTGRVAVYNEAISKLSEVRAAIMGYVE